MHDNGFMKDKKLHLEASSKGGKAKVKKGFAAWPPGKLEAMIKERDRVKREKHKAV